jgi:hypothetical protein
VRPAEREAAGDTTAERRVDRGSNLEEAAEKVSLLRMCRSGCWREEMKAIKDGAEHRMKKMATIENCCGERIDRNFNKMKLAQEQIALYKLIFAN